MRTAMASAQVGDDVYGEDPTVNELESEAASLCGKEAAMFVPSGTMGLMSHCHERGAEVILGDRSHIHLYEQGGIAHLAGIHSRTVRNRPDGTFDLSEVDAKIRCDDVHEPVTRVVCIENTHNEAGGRVLPTGFLHSLRELTTAHRILLHMDGARLFNAAAHLGVEPSELLSYVDSASICLSKGLAAPVGSVVVGSSAFILRARRARKVLGGGWRQAGIVAAAGLVSLREMRHRLTQDHHNARLLAQGLSRLHGEGLSVSVDVDSVETNIFFFRLDPSTTPPRMTAPKLAEALAAPVGGDAEDERPIIRVSAWDEQRIRIVTHYQISEDDVRTVLSAVRRLLSQAAAQRVVVSEAG
ncbi:unnamed protein product [Vitrella brassicaformis CCMP3155]|uniref:Aromatic amino acid beta-eliminating lyase/threonine aldolase domain-containing protein n=1 Tax=Vitrella brassicaformis (strain CCMP3155) TaxID=1169540 RepID=A0A0G4GCG3_VITBC|nr:unnamed protein product [Vitrella brassicaformis CCMP3155]|eukprot:CEM26962.1 unnamed protein product [Vitrella brassicaformis CCMP3155]